MATIKKIGSSYLIRVSTGYRIIKDKNGKPKRVQQRKNFTWKPEPGLTSKQEREELNRQVVKFEERVNTGRVIDGNIKFSEFAEKWMELHASKQLEPKTVHEYRRQLVRINAAIGHVRLDRLQPAQLLGFYDNLSEEGVRTDIRFHATEKLKQAAEDAGLNASQIARLAKIGNSTGQAAVRGEPIIRQSAEAIAKALNYKLSDLFTPVEGKTRLSGTTALAHHRLISSILNYAVEWQVIPFNPADRVRAPRSESKEAKYLDEVQARQLIEALQNEPLQFKTMIIVLVYTGLRRGELCGLKWSDIDFAQSLLQVNRAIQYLPTRGIFEKDPKKKSKRPIKIPSLALRILLEHKNAQEKEAQDCGDAWHDMDLVFTRSDGTYYNPDDLSAAFHEFIINKAVPLGLPAVNAHSLRHTNATLQIAGGVDIRTVSKRLGHAQTSTTMNIYSHAIKSADEAAADALDDILNPNKEKESKVKSGHTKQQKKTKITAISHK